jgi:hypothetical protein
VAEKEAPETSGPDEALKTAWTEEALRAEEAERARQVAREAVARHAEITRRLQRMAQVAGETVSQVARARKGKGAARTAEVSPVDKAERAAGEAQARREETVVRAERLVAGVERFASRAEASRREMEAALRKEKRAVSRARHAREVREKLEARRAAVARKDVRDGPDGVVAPGTGQPDRLVVLPEAPSVATSAESNAAFAIGVKPRAGGARAPGPSFVRRRHRTLSLSVIAVVVVGVVAFVGGRLLREDVPSERRPVPESSGSAPEIVVPELSGLPASRARDVLVTANLRLAGIEPVPGEPGLVAATRPPSGAVVGPGEAVTLLIGVEPDRLEQEQGSP